MLASLSSRTRATSLKSFAFACSAHLSILTDSAFSSSCTPCMSLEVAPCRATAACADHSGCSDLIATACRKAVTPRRSSASLSCKSRMPACKSWHCVVIFSPTLECSLSSKSCDHVLHSSEIFLSMESLRTTSLLASTASHCLAAISSVRFCSSGTCSEDQCLNLSRTSSLHCIQRFSDASNDAVRDVWSLRICSSMSWSAVLTRGVEPSPL
mmetsp:Transcript_34580/g.79041  ORF Transcript_34580/g.79041 Transcript_34580/m.79041 type:complete len:212 (-) Transcript_34580:774-1409(-)